MDLRQLRMFRAVYECGSITGAAERERSAPSVIAHHLANLEHALGATLFERGARGSVPTEAGRRLHAHAASILRAVEIAAEDVGGAAGAPTGRVALGLAYAAVLGIGRPLMARIFEAAPQLHLALAESVSGATVERLLASEVDLAIAFNPSRDARLTLTPLLEEELFCIARPEIAGPAPAPITLDAFLALPYVVARKGAQGRSMADDQGVQKRLEAGAKLSSENVAGGLAFVDHGFGAILGPEAYVTKGGFRHPMVMRPLRPAITRTLYLCERREAAASRAVQLVRGLALEVLAEEIAAGRWPCRPLGPLAEALG